MGRFVHTLTRQIGRDVDRVERSTPYPAMSYRRSDAIAPPIAIAGLLLTAGASAPAVLPSASTGLFSAAEEALMPGHLVPEDSEPAIRSTLPEVEDGRTFNPDPVAPDRTVRGNSVRLKSAPPLVGSLMIPAGISVRAKDQVILCIRRKNRRGTLLALGQGGGYHRRPKRTPKSDIWC